MTSRRFRFEPYVAFTARAMAREATYRFDVFTAIGSVLVRVYLFKTVWTALYLHNAAPRDLPLHAIVTYSTIALMLGLVMDIDQTRALHDRLHDGSIVTDFLKPINVAFSYFADGTGEVLFHALLVIPALLLALFVVHIDVPSWPVLLAFATSATIGYFIGFWINFLLNCTAFWTLEISAVQSIVTWLSGLLGGELVPLVLFPAALVPIVSALPFAAMYSTPLLIYVGEISPANYPAALGAQVFWLVVLGSLAAALWRAGVRRIVVQGG